MVVVELCVCVCVCVCVFMSMHLSVCECIDWLVKSYYSILFLIYIMLVSTHFP